MSRDADDPPTAPIACPKCGHEGEIDVRIRGCNRADEDGEYWLGRCPKCREALDSRDLDECSECGTFGQKLYAGVCGDCRHDEITVRDLFGIPKHVLDKPPTHVTATEMEMIRREKGLL